MYMRTADLGCKRYPWTEFQYRSAQFDLQADQFLQLFKFFKYGLFNSFSEFQFTQAHLKFHPNFLVRPQADTADRPR